MNQTEPEVPGFGRANLSNCEREPIQFAGSIQPFGVFLLAREPELTIVQASLNAAERLGLGTHPVGSTIASLSGDLDRAIAPYLDDPLREHTLAVRARVGDGRHDVFLHRPAGGGLAIELEPADEPVDLTLLVERGLRDIVAAPTLRALCDSSAALLRDLAGYDRVMVYRFDDAGHGEVIAEEREPHLESYLGNHYPESDIPQIARRLYERNRVRMLVDVDYLASPLQPTRSPLSGEPLDMSLCLLRSFSPIHIQYLRNMGVSATLVLSLIVGGRLWGLIACHHYLPRHVGFEVRTASELLAEAVATRIAALESFAEAQADVTVRRLEQRLVESIARSGDWRGALLESPMTLLEPLRAVGAALLFEGQVHAVGDVPATARIREVARWVASRTTGPFATKSLGIDAPGFRDIAPVASGVLAVPVSETPGDLLLWFRPERVRTVTWGGDPRKPVTVGDDPAELSPRRSFAKWQEVVEATAEPWTPPDLTTAHLIGETVSDVVLQFRALRTLIAQDQLEQVRRQVGLSAQPVVVCGHDGAVLLMNEACRRLQPANARPVQSLADIASWFTDSGHVRRQLEELLSRHRTWRGEVMLKVPPKPANAREPRCFMVRADPVFSAPARALGYVLLLTDLTDRKAADAARRRFQEGIVGHGRPSLGPLSTDADLRFQTLISPVVENAQLAALEITEGPDPLRMPRLLDSVQFSVARTADLLGQLLRLGRSPRRLH